MGLKKLAKKIAAPVVQVANPTSLVQNIKKSSGVAAKIQTGAIDVLTLGQSDKLNTMTGGAVDKIKNTINIAPNALQGKSIRSGITDFMSLAQQAGVNPSLGGDFGGFSGDFGSSLNDFFNNLASKSLNGQAGVTVSDPFFSTQSGYAPTSRGNRFPIIPVVVAIIAIIIIILLIRKK